MKASSASTADVRVGGWGDLLAAGGVRRLTLGLSGEGWLPSAGRAVPWFGLAKQGQWSFGLPGQRLPRFRLVAGYSINCADGGRRVFSASVVWVWIQLVLS